MTTLFGGGRVLTVKLIDPLPERDCASDMVKGMVFTPGVVLFATVALKVKVFPLPENDCVGEPPIDDRSATTAKPVLGGLFPGITFTVSSVESPGNTEDGLALPVPEGFVATTPLAVIEKSSTAKPSSAPVASTSV